MIALQTLSVKLRLYYPDYRTVSRLPLMLAAQKRLLLV